MKPHLAAAEKTPLVLLATCPYCGQEQHHERKGSWLKLADPNEVEEKAAELRPGRAFPVRLTEALQCVNCAKVWERRTWAWLHAAAVFAHLGSGQVGRLEE